MADEHTAVVSDEGVAVPLQGTRKDNDKVRRGTWRLAGEAPRRRGATGHLGDQDTGGDRRRQRDPALRGDMGRAVAAGITSASWPAWLASGRCTSTPTSSPTPACTRHWPTSKTSPYPECTDTRTILRSSARRSSSWSASRATFQADAPHWNTAGFVFDATPARRRAMWEDAVRVLAALHQVDSARFPFLVTSPQRSGLGDDLEYWRRSLAMATGQPPHEGLERGYEWLLSHMPVPSPTSFSWGDSRFANVMFRDDRVVAIFDWDTASLAGPEADLAWWRYMDGPSGALAGIGGPEELVQRWEEHTGRKVQDLAWHDTFTMFRLGVIMRNLFHNMAAEGQLPPEVAVEQGRDSEPAKRLAAYLDAIA